MTNTPIRSPRWPVVITGAVALAALGGCTSYQPQPLSQQSPLATGLDGLWVDASALHPNAADQRADRYPFDPGDGLDLTEVGILAVLNNPDLKARRSRLLVAAAQAFSAGLLPDPQFGASLDKPIGNTAGLFNAWSLGLSYDIIPLITRAARVDAADRSQQQVRLDLLWQEWQVIQRARSLAVALQLQQQRLRLLQRMQALYSERYQRSARALEAGDVTLDVNGTDLTALLDTLSQINQLQQTHNQTRHDFNLLLGLQPQVMMTLSPLPGKLQQPALDAPAIAAQMAALPGLRPDLLALQAGYQSQEASVRAAVLAQFPSLGVGINRASDTSKVDTLGPSITLSLPLFSGNRGNIAIQRATRDQLQQEYRARLAQTRIDVARLLALQTILQRQQDALQTYLPRLKTLVDRASRAYQQGDIDALTFLNMESTWVNKRLEQLSLTQSAWENRIALETLLALPDYPASSLTAPSEHKDKTR